MRTPESVLAEFPDWADAVISELSGGLSNRTWLVEAGNRRAVLKIDEAPREAPFNARRAEAQIQTTAAEQGLANDVLLATDTVYMTEYVDGVVWSLDCLDDDANIEQLAVALRKLHSLPLTGRTFDAMGAARNYVSRITDPDVDKVRECLRKIEAGPLPPNLCCCHNDLVMGNILNVPETRFLDWEYACDNDPFFDLATIAAHHKLTREQRETLLDAYFDGNGARWREQLARQADVYEALLYLWSRSRGA
jgi:thiamine kinase-like enzyme